MLSISKFPKSPCSMNSQGKPPNLSSLVCKKKKGHNNNTYLFYFLKNSNEFTYRQLCAEKVSFKK